MNFYLLVHFYAKLKESLYEVNIYISIIAIGDE